MDRLGWRVCGEKRRQRPHSLSQLWFGVAAVVLAGGGQFVGKASEPDFRLSSSGCRAETWPGRRNWSGFDASAGAGHSEDPGDVGL